MAGKLWYLKRCDLFARLSPERIAAVESRCTARNFPRGSPVYLPAEESDGVLMVASGRVKICSFTGDGKQAILTFIEPGELFGELAILDSGAREEYAEAAEASTVVLIPVDEMQQLMAENPEVALGVTKLFGLRRRRVERRLKYLLFKSNRERLVHLLLELAEQYGYTTDDGVALRIKLSHQDLANIIGSTRETVTVILGELQDEKLLIVGRRKLVLTKLNLLAASVQEPTPKIESMFG